MSLYTKLNDDLKAAMRSSDTLRRDVLRALIAAVKNEAINLKVSPEEMEEKTVVSVLRRAAKQRSDAAEGFRRGGRNEAAAREEAETRIIAEYLPQQMSEAEVEKFVDDLLTGEEDLSQMGAVMGRVMKELSGRADGALVRRIVQQKLSR